MKRILFLISLMFLVLLASCDKDDEQQPIENTTPESFVVNDSQIINVSDNSITLNNSNNDFETNDIIVSGSNESAPKGFLRKITNISNQNGNTLLTTVRTTLEEGLKYYEGLEETNEISFNHTFQQEDSLRNQTKSNFSIPIEINETITVNNSELTINGLLEITPSIEGNIIINKPLLGLPSIELIELISQAENNLSLTISSQIEGSFDEEILIGHFQSSPINIWIGGFPVVVIPNVSLSVGANGQLTANLAYNYTNNSTITAGIVYDENWSFYDGNGFVVNSSEATASAEVTGIAEAYIKPEFGISLYDEGFVNTGVNVKPYVRFEGEINTEGYEYGFYGGVTAGAFFNASVFGFNLIDKEWDDLISSPEYNINSGTSNNPNISDPFPEIGATITQQPITLTWLTNNFDETPTFEVFFGEFESNLQSLAFTQNSTYTLPQTYENGQYFWKIIARNASNDLIAESIVYNFIINENSNLPTVSTTTITNITETTATSGGNITDDGGTSVTARGVCWSTNPNPTTANSITDDGLGTGEYVSSLTGLTQNTTYYARAYAANSEGTAYGNQIQFTTLANGNVPTVTTNTITNITETTAISGGNVTDNGGNNVTTRGVCWSTNPNPTIANFTTNDGTGTGNFASSITVLQPNTQYYVRAYATNSEGTAYGVEFSFTTQNDSSGNIYEGDYIIINQQNINDFNNDNYTEITGDLNIILSSNITNLQGLESLVTLGGSLFIDDNSNLLSLLGLDNIENIGGDVYIANNDLLNNIGSLNNLNSIGGYIQFRSNPSLMQINGLSNLDSIGDYVLLYHNNSLVNFDGLSTVTEIFGDISILGNDELINLNGFNNLNQLDGNIYIGIGSTGVFDGNSNLINFCGLTNLIVNGSFQGTYNVTNNGYNPSLQDAIDGNCSL